MVHAGATCDFCFYDTPVAMRVSVSISMSGTTAFKRCILGAMAVRTTTIGHASDSGGWSVLALGVSHSFGRHHLILGPAWSFGFRKVGIFARGFFWSGTTDILLACMLWRLTLDYIHSS